MTITNIPSTTSTITPTGVSNAPSTPPTPVVSPSSQAADDHFEPTQGASGNLQVTSAPTMHPAHILQILKSAIAEISTNTAPAREDVSAKVGELTETITQERTNLSADLADLVEKVEILVAHQAKQLKQLARFGEEVAKTKWQEWLEKPVELKKTTTDLSETLKQLKDGIASIKEKMVALRQLTKDLKAQMDAETAAEKSDLQEATIELAGSVIGSTQVFVEQNEAVVDSVANLAQQTVNQIEVTARSIAEAAKQMATEWLWDKVK